MDVDKVQNIVTYTAGAVAVFSLIGALYQSMSKDNGSAAPTLIVFLAACVVVFLPLISQFSLPGFEARMNNRVNEVKAIEETVRKIAAVNARVTYMTLAWANRLGSPSTKDKQSLLDDVDKQLREFKVTDEERQSIVRPVVQMLKFDFYFGLRTVVHEYAGIRYGRLVERARREAPDAVAERDKHSDLMTIYSKRLEGADVWRRLDSFSLEEELNNATPEWLNETEAKALADWKKRILRIAGECEKKGGYTPEGVQLQDSLTQEPKAIAESIFRQSIEELKR